MTIALIDGKFLSENEAAIPITDRGLLFGDGVFSTIRVNQGSIEGLKTHLKNLYSQCEVINLECPSIKDEWIHDLINRNSAAQGIWRLKIIVTGGDDCGRDLKKRRGRLIMTLKPVPSVPSEVRLGIYPIPCSTPLAHLKSLAYLDRLHMADYASKINVDDVLVLSSDGHLLETSCANIFWFENGNFFSPQPSHNLLTGATLGLLSREIKISFVNKKLDEIAASAQVYLCNSIRGIIPVVQIDKKAFARNLELEAVLAEGYQAALLKDKNDFYHSCPRIEDCSIMSHLRS